MPRQYTYTTMPCANPVSSECVLYVGNQLKTQTVDESCMPSITEVIENLDSNLNTINKNLDLSSVKSFLTLDMSKATNKDVIQAILSSLGNTRDELAKIKTTKNQDILSLPIQIDLSTLGTSYSNTNSSTLLTILSLLVREIVDLKSKFNSSTGYYQPY